MAKVLIIGGGVAGLEAGLTLARQGIHSVIIEKGRELGGYAAKYNCKAVDGVCRSCGACLARQKVYQVARQELVEVCLSTVVTLVEATPEGYRVEVAGEGEKREFGVEGIIVALGLSVFPAEVRGEFGYRRLPGVITALDLEAIIKESPEILGDSPHLAFIQCVGSREVRDGAPYCSRVCCFYVPKLVELVSSRVQDSRADVYYIDRQRYEGIYRLAPVGAGYVRAIPGKIFPAPYGRLELSYNDPASGKVYRAGYDWVVLCPAIRPGRDVPEVAQLLAIDTDQNGFVHVVKGGVTNRKGVLAAGACTAPMSIIESITSGRAAAGEMSRFLRV